MIRMKLSIFTLTAPAEVIPAPVDMVWSSFMVNIVKNSVLAFAGQPITGWS